MITVNGKLLKYTIGDIVYIKTDVLDSKENASSYIVTGYVIHEHSVLPIVRNAEVEQRLYEFEITDDKYYAGD
jgi:hypothetical protein